MLKTHPQRPPLCHAFRSPISNVVLKPESPIFIHNHVSHAPFNHYFVARLLLRPPALS